MHGFNFHFSGKHLKCYSGTLKKPPNMLLLWTLKVLKLALFLKVPITVLHLKEIPISWYSAWDHHFFPITIHQTPSNKSYFYELYLVPILKMHPMLNLEAGTFSVTFIFKNYCQSHKQYRWWSSIFLISGRRKTDIWEFFWGVKLLAAVDAFYLAKI